MTAARKLELISVDDYLAGELVSPVKHEYLSGMVYAMAGASNQHNRIAMNLSGELYSILRGKPCQPYNSDTKIRVRPPHQQPRFYYPDVSVVCQSNSPEDSYQDEPVVVFEVLSPSTRRIDEVEKRDGYLTIRSLCVYVLVDQNAASVLIYRRRGTEFEREVYEGLESVIPLPEIECELSLSDIYAGVEFIPEPPSEESLCP